MKIARYRLLHLMYVRDSRSYFLNEAFVVLYLIVNDFLQHWFSNVSKHFAPWITRALRIFVQPRCFIKKNRSVSSRRSFLNYWLKRNREIIAGKRRCRDNRQITIRDREGWRWGRNEARRVGNVVLAWLFPGFPCYAPTIQAAFNQLSIAPQLCGCRFLVSPAPVWRLLNRRSHASKMD